jgi:hypothetical protein
MLSMNDRFSFKIPVFLELEPIQKILGNELPFQYVRKAVFNYSCRLMGHLFSLSWNLRHLLLCLFPCFVSSLSEAQVIHDLTIGDQFLPHLSEQQKQEFLIKSFREKTNGKVPNTSEELYPNLYKSTNKDYLAPIRGTSADPANAFKDYSKVEYMKPTGSSSAFAPSVSSALYNNQLSMEERNRLEIEADMAAYEAQKENQQKILEEANKEFAPEVNYHLGLHNGPAVDRYLKAYTELQAMLSGEQKIDFLKAVWLVESSLDNSLSWEEFNGMFQDGLQVISQLMIQDKVSPNDNLSKIMSIYKYMADTTKVYLKAKEKTIVSKPMLYDYEDFAGKEDITKVFVSKLLRTGTGQCMSLPMLYYLYAKAFGAETYIAFAPQHSYITFKDKIGNWQNIELTGRMFISTDFHWQSGFITAEQVKSGIYLKPLTEKETIAYLLTTLALTYVKTIGTDDHVLQMATTAKQYSPKNLTAHMIYAGYYKDTWQNILRQYDMFRLSDDKFNSDEQAKAIKQKAELAVQYIKKDLGWKEMPDWAYKRWLDGVNELANRDRHIVRRRQLEQQLSGNK